MSKLIAAYKAVITAVSIDENIRGSKTAVKVGTEGELSIWKSEKLHPGEKYIQFKPNNGGFELRTSCGEIEMNEAILTICTQNASHVYSFELKEKMQTIEFKMIMPERFLHVCCSCHKREILSSEEAYEKGWDYPGKDGIYKTVQNHGFAILAPRTCGDCGINQSLYWRMMAGEELTNIDKETMERIQNEPGSLIVDDVQSDVMD